VAATPASLPADEDSRHRPASLTSGASAAAVFAVAWAAAAAAEEDAGGATAAVAAAAAAAAADAAAAAAAAATATVAAEETAAVPLRSGERLRCRLCAAASATDALIALVPPRAPTALPTAPFLLPRVPCSNARACWASCHPLGVGDAPL